MSWKDIFNSRLMSAQEAAKIVQSGDRFWTPLCCWTAVHADHGPIADRKDELKDVEYCHALVLRPYKIFKPEFRDSFKLVWDSTAPPTFQEIAKTEWSNFWLPSCSISPSRMPPSADVPRRGASLRR